MNKLRSIIAAATLLTAGACSETSLSLAPDRPTLPAPEIELTSQYARTCIAEMFRALASPEVLCPNPLEGDDISEEDATNAQNKYDQCLIDVPEVESIMSDEVITLFTPFLPQDFDFSGSIAEVQDRIANAAIPLTVFASYDDHDYVDYNLSYMFARLIITPGFIEEADLSEANRSEANNFSTMLRNHNIAYLHLKSSKNPYSDERVSGTSAFTSIPSDYLERSQSGGFISPSFNLALYDYVGTSDDRVHIYGSTGEDLNYYSLRSDITVHLIISKSIGKCIEDAAELATGGEGFTVMHLE